MPSNTTSGVFFYIYVLESLRDKQRFIGYTSNLKKRLEEHKMPNAKNYLKILQIIKLFLYLISKTKPHKMAFVAGS